MKVNNQKLEKYFPRVIEIWNANMQYDFANTFCEVAPTSIDSFNQDCDVLFLGLNPSLRISEKGTINAPVWETYKKVWSFKLEHIQKEQNADGYFSSFQKMAKNIGIGNNWSYLDLLFIRHTSQKEIQNFCYESPEASKFVWDQLQITRQIIEEINPKVIVVTNKFAETLLGKHKKKDGSNAWMELKFEATENPNVYKWNKIDVIFTGYLKFKSESEKAEIENTIKSLIQK